MAQTPSIDRRDGVSIDPDGLPLFALHWKTVDADFDSARVNGANVPDWVTLRDGVAAYEFSATLLKEVWCNFSIPHDYAPGTDMWPDIRFVPTTNEVEGVVRWGIEYTVAKRGQEAFPATTTVYIEKTIPANSQYAHLVGEVLPADVIPAASLEVDAIVLARVFRDGAHANDTYAGTVCGLFTSLVYQSDRLGTIGKEDSDFYSE